MKALLGTLALGLMTVPAYSSMVPVDIQLFRAARDGNLNQVQGALCNGAYINNHDYLGFTPLHYAVGHGQTEIVKLLLNTGTEVNAQSNTGATPLHEAAHKGHTPIAELLLTAGADINAHTRRDRGNMTPLHWAVMQGHIATVKFLLDAGADKSARDTNYYTSLHQAVKKGHITTVKLLLDAGANINAQDQFMTPLNWAIRNGYTDLTKLLLNTGATINTLDTNEFKPLDVAAHDGHTQVVELIKSYLKLLEQIKLEPKKQLLTQTIDFGYVHLVKLLLQAGIKPDIHDLALVKLKYNQEPKQWHKDSYKAIGRMLLQHLRLSGALQAPELDRINNLMQQSFTPHSVKNTNGPIAKSGLGLPEDIAHMVFGFYAKLYNYTTML